MAINFTTIKNTNQETIIKFQGVASDSGTITLSTLTASTQALTVGGTPTVNIVRFAATGLLTSGVTVARNGTTILAAAPENAPTIDLTGFSGISDSVQNTQNIVINITGAAVTGYIVLRKISGWSSKVEEPFFGAYDDRTVVGS